MNNFAKNLKLARKARGYTQKEIAEKINLSNSTYSLYESGDREPNLSTIEKIAHVLYVSIDELFGLYDFGTKELLREASEVYHTKPICTCNEFYELPDGEHAELIFGQLYYLSAPSRLHQEIVGGLYYILISYIRKNNGNCKVYLSPFTVKLCEDEHVIVQPDISVICESSKLDDKGCNGAPNLIIEVTSPSNKKRDYIDKLKLYSDFNVEEYIIVDPDANNVIIYQLSNNTFHPTIYDFDTEFSIHTFKNLNLKIDDLL